MLKQATLIQSSKPAILLYNSLKDRRKMGANMSNYQNNPNGFSFLHAQQSTQMSQIKEFRSKDQWNVYFEASKETNKLLVIDFTATWCGPCKFMEPTIKDFASKYTDVQFVKIDVDKFAEVARVFEVQALPAFILVKRGKTVDRVVGAKKEELQKKIEKHRF